jgi:hypothetical protein
MRSFAVALALTLGTICIAGAEIHARAFMTPAQFHAAGLHKLSPSEIRALDRWFARTCAADGGGFRLRPRPDIVSTARDFTELLDASLIAGDGKFLGKISRNTLDSESISNTMSPHGSTLSAESIFNTLGQYGSTLSSLSPFNSLAASPPRIVKAGRQLGYLTKNSMKQPATDPDELLKWLGLNRDE